MDNAFFATSGRKIPHGETRRKESVMEEALFSCGFIIIIIIITDELAWKETEDDVEKGAEGGVGGRKAPLAQRMANSSSSSSRTTEL